MIISCSNHENKSHYEVNPNEEVEIYYTTNSCCYYCIVNEAELKHVMLKDDKQVAPPPSGVDGGSYTRAFVFFAVSAGTDTIKLREVPGGEDCATHTGPTENYIISVK